MTLSSLLAWLADPARWQGSDSIPLRVGEHILLTALAVGIAALVALPLGLYAGHTGRFAFLAINVANLGRALPSLALLALALPVSIALGQGLGAFPTLLAMIPLAIPPILTNAYAGVRAVDRDTVDAARGMGLREWQILRAVEVPAGLPVILAGLRTATVNVVATVTLGALVAGGTLGRYIVDGLALQEHERLVSGALLVALLAVAAEAGFALLERSAAHTRSKMA